MATDAFREAIGALFGDPWIGTDAIVTLPGRDPVRTRAIHFPAEAVAGGGATRQFQGSDRIDLPVATFPDRPPERTMIALGTRSFRVREAVRDSLRLAWECDCDEV